MNRKSERQKLVELGVKRKRDDDDDGLPSAKLPQPHLAVPETPPVTMLEALTIPNLVFGFDISLGAFAIKGGCTTTLAGVLYFPRIKGEKCSFALAIPDKPPFSDLYAWIGKADRDLATALADSKMNAEVGAKFKTWDGAPGVHLVNFYGDNFPWLDAEDNQPKVTTFQESLNAVHGTPIVILVRVGNKTSISNSKLGDAVVSWPLYCQSIRIYPDPPPALLELKNGDSAVAFPMIPKLK